MKGSQSETKGAKSTHARSRSASETLSPCGVEHQIIRIDAADAGSHVPTRGSAKGGLIRRGSVGKGGNDDSHASSAFSSSSRYRALGNTGITLTLIGHRGHLPGSCINRRRAFGLYSAGVNDGTSG